MRNSVKIPAIIGGFVAILVIAGAVYVNRIGATSPEVVPVLRIAEQYGLAYAPVSVMRLTGILDEELPDYSIEWVRLGNAAAIREAMVARRLDIGFMGIPPFLIGEDRGMDWEIFTGLSITPLGLVTTDTGVLTLADLDESHRIAVPQPGSIQHILLSMAASRTFADPAYFDNRLVSLAHPDAMQAMLSGAEISAHFTSPPYLFEELRAPGARLLLSGTEAFGGRFSFIVGVTTKELRESNPELLLHVTRALDRAALRIEDETVQGELAEYYGLAVEELRSMLGAEGNEFTGEVLGVEEFREFMTEAGYLTGNASAREAGAE